MGSLYGNSEQKDTDARFQEDVCNDISWFACPPPLHRKGQHNVQWLSVDP